eukprot:12366579-Karenia_brevis.AAC.1
MNDWEYTICGMKAIPPGDIMETLFIKQLRTCGHLKRQLALYELEVTQKNVPRSYDRLVQVVRIHLESRRRMRNRENMEHGHGHGLAGEAVGKGGEKGQKGKSKSPAGAR